MNFMEPYLFWFEFEDSVMESTAAYSNEYFLECVILSPNSEDAGHWGKTLTNQFLKQGLARRITSSWIEAMLPAKLTTVGLVQVDWSMIKPANLHGHYQGTAGLPGQRTSNINALIEASSQDIALALWKQYVVEHYPEYVIETCSKWDVPITEVGKYVDW